MTQAIRIELILTIPDGTSVSVAPAVSPPTSDEPPHPASYTPAQVMDQWPVGRCPKHTVDFIPGNYGPYCPIKDASPPSNPKGYCSLKPGVVWNDRRIP